MGGTDGTMGTPGQYPGSPPPGSRMPVPQPPPRDRSAGIPKTERVKPEELMIQTAMPEGEHQSAVSGYLYFPYSGKIKSIKTLELLYGDAVLKLR